MKQLIRDLVPPFLWRTLSKLWHMLGTPCSHPDKIQEYEYMPQGWQTAQTNPKIKGWNVPEVLEAYKAKWPNFVQSLEEKRPFGLPPDSCESHHPDVTYHNAIMSYAYALTLASRQKDSLSLLDWGGCLGHYYLISKSLLPDVDMDYHCKDVPVLTEYGRTLLPHAHFYTDESCLTRKYDLVLVSASLHYSEDWRSTLKGLAQATGAYLFVSSLPVVQKSPSYVFIQRPYQYGYNTEYLGWCLNRQEFLGFAATVGLALVREFIIGYRPFIYRAPEQDEYRGFLFCLK